MEWADNPFLDQEEIEQLTRAMSPTELETRRFGKFRSEGGLVYPEFDPCIHVIEPFDVPREWYDNVSIDPGLNNPLSCHFYAVDFDGNVYVVAEHFEAGKDVGYHANKIREICDRLNWKRGRGGYIEALIDSAANQRTLACSRSVTELFYEHNVLANPRVNKEMFSGIQRVKQYLKVNDGKSKLYIFPNCVNLIRELKKYRWGEGDVPIKSDDHALDELRYYLMTKPENLPPKKQKTEIQKDKERLIRMIINERKK
jgi:phage terminase large subunit